MVLPCRMGRLAKRIAAITFACQLLAGQVLPAGAADEPPKGSRQEVPLAQFPQDPNALVVPLTRAGRWLCAKVKIDSQDAGWFILDTGATNTQIDSQVVQKLKLRKVGQSVLHIPTGTLNHEVVEYDELTAGPLVLKRGVAGAVDLHHISSMVGFTIAGFLGDDVLREHPCTIDFRLGTLTLYKREHFAPMASAHVERLSLRAMRRPCFLAQVEGHEGWFMLDTGSEDFLALERAFTKEHFSTLRGRHPASRPNSDMSVLRESVYADFGPVELLGRAYPRMSAGFDGTDGDDIAGIVGAPALSDGRFTFDFRAGKLWVEWQKPEATPQALARLGPTNGRDLEGVTPLMRAVRDGRVDLVKALVDRGADVNAKDSDDFTALTFAAAAGDAQIVSTLLSHGADPNVAAVIRALTPLHLAARSGHQAAAASLLAAGANVDAKETGGQTPLFWAAVADYSDVVHTLLGAGAKVNLRDHDGNTVLCYAAATGGVDIIMQLISKGADLNPGLVTPLHAAASNDNVAAAECLLAHGAHVNAMDSEGETPLMRAATQSYEDIVKVLLRHGADPNVRSRAGKTAVEYATDLSVIRDLILAGGHHPNSGH